MKRKKNILIVLFLIIIVLLGGGGFYYYKKIYLINKKNHYLNSLADIYEENNILIENINYLNGALFFDEDRNKTIIDYENVVSDFDKRKSELNLLYSKRIALKEMEDIYVCQKDLLSITNDLSNNLKQILTLFKEGSSDEIINSQKDNINNIIEKYNKNNNKLLTKYKSLAN